MGKKYPGKNPQKMNPQVSSRGLLLTPPPLVLEEEAAIYPQLVQPVTSVSDFQTPSTSKLPVVLRFGDQFYCIDGWHKIESAIANDAEELRCRIKIHDCAFDPAELAIQKVSRRIKPELGKISYSEQLLAVRQLHDILIAENDNLIRYNHGGSRNLEPSETSGGNSVDDVVTALRQRLDKGRSTIQNYLNYSDNLTIECLQELATKRTKQRFFEIAQRNKRALLDDLVDGGITGVTLSVRISEEMIRWYEEFDRTGMVSPYERIAAGDSDETESVQEEEPEVSMNECDNPDVGSSDDVSPSETLDLYTPQSITNEPPVPEFTDIKTEYIQFLENAILDSRALDSPVHVKEHMATVIREILRLQSMIDSERAGDHARSSDVEVA